MPERELDLPKEKHAQGIMKYVLHEQEGEGVKFSILKGGQAKIQKHFISFFASRKIREGLPKPKEDPELQKLQTVPQINEYSRQLASETRGAMYGKKANIVSVLYDKEKDRQQQKEAKAKKLKEELDAKEQSTFKPFTLNYNSHQVRKGDRCLELYSRVKPGLYAKKKDVSTDEREWQKQEKECTHAPKIINYHPNVVQLSEIKGIDMTLHKM